MKTLAQTKYQDIYRVTDGVLLVVNKFEPLYIEGVEYPRVSPVNRAGMRSYNKNCQQQLPIKNCARNQTGKTGSQTRIVRQSPIREGV